MCVPDRLAVAIGIRGWRQRVPVRWAIPFAIQFSIAMASSSLMAANGIWSSTAGTGAWQTSTNWLSGIIPGATSGTTNTDTATFNSSSSTSLIVPDPNRNLENISFDASATSYTIGATGGNSLFLTSGGSIQISSTFSRSSLFETINSPLVFEGNYTLTDNCTNTGVLLDVGGGISAASSSLTLSGPGSIFVSGNISGGVSVSKTGIGTVYFSGNNSYSGGTTVTAGTLVTSSLGDPTSPITVSAAAGVNSALVLGAIQQGQTVGSLAGTVAPMGSAEVSISDNDTLTVNQATNTTFEGTILNSGRLLKSGAGTLEITGAPTWSNLSSIQVAGGNLRLNVASGSPSVGSGVEATVSSGATLELSGPISALSSGSNRVNVSNNSTLPGLLVSGKHQQVGGIDGSGATQVNAGSDLTANHIVQAVLVIGGTAGSPGLVTIDASDASGNPLGQTSELAFADSLTPIAVFGAGRVSSASLNGAGGDTNPSVLSPGNSAVGGSPSSVPEPSSLILLAIGGLAVSGVAICRRCHGIAG